MSRQKHPESSYVIEHFKSKLFDFMVDFVDINAKLREEYQWPPSSFDFLTRQTLTEVELVKYNQELAKKRDEYIKRTKKKPLKRK